MPVRGAQSIGVRVDDGNGITDCDYFALGFTDIVVETTTVTAPAQGTGHG